MWGLEFFVVFLLNYLYFSTLEESSCSWSFIPVYLNGVAYILCVVEGHENYIFFNPAGGFITDCVGM